MNHFEKLGGRKFLLTLIVIGVGTAIELLTTRGVSTGFVSLLVGVLGVFSASNVAITNKAINQAPAADGTPSPSAIDTSLIEAEIAMLKANQDQLQSNLGVFGQALETMRKLIAAALELK